MLPQMTGGANKMSEKQAAMEPKGKLLPIFKRLYKYAFSQQKLTVFIVAGLLVSSVLSLAPAWIVRITFDSCLVPGKTNYLIGAGLIIILTAMLQGVIDFLTRYYSEVNGQKTIFAIRNDVYSHLLGQSFTYYDKTRTGDILSRVTSDAETLQSFLGFASVNIVSNVLFIVGVFVVMIIWNVKLSLIYLAFMPFIVFGIYRYAFRLRPANMKLRKIMGRMSSVMQEQLRAIQVIKTFGGEARAVESCEKANRQYMEVGFKTGRIEAFWLPYVSVFIGIGTGVILWYGGSKVISGSVSIGMLSGFITYISTMIRPVRQTGMLMGNAITAAAAAERIFEVLDIAPEVQDAPDARGISDVEGCIEYRNVSFSYDKKTPVLDRVSFVAKPGETVAVVGPTGAGKSTVMNLLPRFYDADEGEILIDGVNIKNYTIRSLRANIGIVMQDTFLFNLSIKENISFGKPQASLAEIRAAAQAAQIDDFIMGLPQQYDTAVGERGMMLSGGQRQRISIARTLLTDPPLLILDEPTASVDSVTDEKIMAAIDTLRKGRTVFMIAHRLWTLKSADRILVLDGGKIVQNGTHQELMAEKGPYRESYSLQADSESYGIPAMKGGKQNG
ncbi:MAG: ABC transporter ATP-binding protein [Clostridia bacterium]|nr:ABC transporter ATP-binding protein [Clostridia bacterium]